MKLQNYTNILSTLGPASSTKEEIKNLVLAGANAFRLNFSHGDYETHTRVYNNVREVEKEVGFPIAVIADMQGPKLRVGTFKNDAVILKNGNEFTLDMNTEDGDETRVCLPHKEIFKALKAGDFLLLNDGNIKLQVISCDENHAVTKVINGGKLSSKKGVNFPDTDLPISALTEKDLKDLDFALKLGADWIAVSFVQKPEDVKLAKSIINGKAGVISKLEKPSAIEHLEEIVYESDAIMVARGDLGVECPIETIPVIQKQIIRTCRAQGKPVIVATQMLESMIEAPFPTRAEVSDIATAVYDGVDCVMLSAETAAGKFPREAVNMMNNIIAQVEKDPLFCRFMKASRTTPEANESDAITCAAREASYILNNVAAIATYTTTGTTTLRAAKERPCHPIVAVTPDIKVARKLAIVWGIYSFAIQSKDFEEFSDVKETILEIVKENGIAKSGENIVITAGYPINSKGRTNIMHTALVE